MPRGTAQIDIKKHKTKQRKRQKQHPQSYPNRFFPYICLVQNLISSPARGLLKTQSMKFERGRDRETEIQSARETGRKGKRERERERERDIIPILFKCKLHCMKPVFLFRSNLTLVHSYNNFFITLLS